MTVQDKMIAKAFHVESTGTTTTGACMTLKDRKDGKKDVLLTSPLNIEINVDNNNNDPGGDLGDYIVFSYGSGAARKVLAILDKRGDLSIAGKIKTDANLAHL